MPEEKNISSVKIKIKKSRKKPDRKKSAEKSPFKLSDSLNAAPAMPESGFKVKNQALPAKSGEAKGIYRKIAFSFIALTLILVTAVLYFNFSKLTVTIIPVQEKINGGANFEINDSSVALTGENIISGTVKQVPVELAKEFSASGQEILGEEVAGKVIIINNYIKNQPLVATTRLLSADNKLFRLKSTVNVPAGGKVEAEVYADQAKPEMAIGAGKFTIPGLWAGIQDKIYAESSSPMEYSQKVKYIIKQSDIDNAVNQLRSELLAGAKNEVSQAYQNYAQVIFAVDNNSVSQELGGKVGEEKEKFGLKMKTLVTVVAFNDGEIYDNAKTKLAADLADDKELVEFNKADIVYALENYNISRGTAMVSAVYTAKAALKEGAGVIKKSNLAGRDREQLKAYLNSLPEVAGYEIRFFPSFVKKAPSLADRIKIEIKK
ncbi:MAG: hypothetical protein Q8O93_00945 [bacterium]|nr:hypothetical protein [bacterium]